MTPKTKRPWPSRFLRWAWDARPIIREPKFICFLCLAFVSAVLIAPGQSNVAG